MRSLAVAKLLVVIVVPSPNMISSVSSVFTPSMEWLFC